MATLLVGDTLGEKHKHFNSLVKEAVVNKKKLDIDNLSSDDFDINNLINIDVANNQRDIDYIIKVLICDDMLYVSRAIKNCEWILDSVYSHIINPVYLQSELYPRMSAKASIKLKQFIQRTLKNEERSEQFYKFEENLSEAIKWLPNCSVKFIENVFTKHVERVSISLLKRLCEKSIIFLEIYMKSPNAYKRKGFEATMFLLHVDLNRYLDLVESQSSYDRPMFGKRATKFLMTNCPDRIITKFAKYCFNIDAFTFVKHLKDSPMDFLLKKVDESISDKDTLEIKIFFTKFNKLKIFVNAMNTKERFEFVKKMFLDEEKQSEKENISNKLNSQVITLRAWHTHTPKYEWYQFAPFDIAFPNIKNMFQSDTSPSNKTSMFGVIIASVKGNLNHAKVILQYFRDKHMNSSVKVKNEFVKKIILNFDYHKFDEETWNILEDIINNINSDTEIDLRMIIEATIVHKVVHNEYPSNEFEDKFEFDTLKTFQKKLDGKEKELLFTFLNKFIWKKIQSVKITQESEFKESIQLIEKAMTLLKDWNKEISDYPILLDTIKEYVKLKQMHGWNINMSSVYNLKKSWRKRMFHDSIVLYPTADVCINALKHRPALLEVYNNEVESMLFNEKVALKRVLQKVKVYWPHLLTRRWISVYLKGLEELKGHRALARGLSILLPRSELLEILKKYAPKDAKVDWSKTEELELSLQRHFAKNMHFARPQPPPEAVLLYAKGDYLQYALPSLFAIFYNLSCVQIRRYVPNLLEAPISLQKYGIRFAFAKLTPEELKETFSNIWKTTKNATIRTEIFKFTFNILCNGKDDIKIKDTWDLLETFIDSLTLTENKVIYELLYRISDVPLSVRANYLMKSYKFLKNLTSQKKDEYDDYKWDVSRVLLESRKIMHMICPEFIKDILVEFCENDFLNQKMYSNDMTSLLSTYLLCAKEEEIQIKKYKDIMEPTLHRCFEQWYKVDDEQYFIKYNVELLLKDFINGLKSYVYEENMVVPYTMFLRIDEAFERTLSVSENYVILRSWKLITELVKWLEQNPLVDDQWDKACSKLAPEMGKICMDILREDTKIYSSRVYVLFSKALNCLTRILPQTVQYNIYASMVDDADFVPGYLVALSFVDYLNDDEVLEKKEMLRETIKNHPSVEVKMHYYSTFSQNRSLIVH